MGSNKRGMEGDHLSKEQWEAAQDVDERDIVQEEPKGPFAKASATEMKGRRIIRVTRKSKWNAGGDNAAPPKPADPPVSLNNPFGGISGFSAAAGASAASQSSTNGSTAPNSNPFANVTLVSKFAAPVAPPTSSRPVVLPVSAAAVGANNKPTLAQRADDLHRAFFKQIQTNAKYNLRSDWSVMVQEYRAFADRLSNEEEKATPPSSTTTSIPTATSQLPKSPLDSKPSASGLSFSFGSTASPAALPVPFPPSSPAPSASFSFGAATSPAALPIPSASTVPASVPFSFGSASTAPPSPSPKPASGFSFGASSAPSTSSAPGTSPTPAAKPFTGFSFGNPTAITNNTSASTIASASTAPSSNGTGVLAGGDEDEEQKDEPEKLLAEENSKEDCLFELRSKYYKYNGETKQWKDYSKGPLRCYRDKEDPTKHRVVLRSDIGKVQLNLKISKGMKFSKTVNKKRKAFISFIAVQDAKSGPESFMLAAAMDKVDKLLETLESMAK